MDDDPTTIFGLANRMVIQQEMDRVAQERTQRLEGEVTADLTTGEVAATVSYQKSWKNGWGWLGNGWSATGWFGWKKKPGPDDKLVGGRLTKEL